jgi:hypothetical protein
VPCNNWGFSGGDVKNPSISFTTKKTSNLINHSVYLNSVVLNSTLNNCTFYVSCDFHFRAFIEEKLGIKYVEARTVEFSKSFEEASPSTPIFFILSPGVNPLKVSDGTCTHEEILE